MQAVAFLLTSMQAPQPTSRFENAEVAEIFANVPLGQVKGPSGP